MTGHPNPARALPWQVWLLTAPILTAIYAFPGCDRPRPGAPQELSSNKPARVIWISPSHYEAGWPAIRSAAEAQARALGTVILEFIAPADGGGSNAELLNAAVRTAAARKPDAICFWLQDPEAESAALDAARTSGALVITLGVRPRSINTYAHVDCGAAQAATLLGRFLIQAPAGIRSYLLLHEARGTGTGRDCYDRFRLEAARQTGPALLEERDITNQEPRAALNDLLQRFRYAGLIITLSPRLWHETPPEVTLRESSAHFATIGASPELWPALRSGQAIALAGPLDGQIGKAVLDAVISGLTHSRAAGFERTIDAELVTAETLDDFARRYEAAAGNAATSTPAP